MAAGARMAGPAVSSGSGGSPRERVDALLAAGRATREALDALFDSLGPVAPEAMIGDWRGAPLPTGDVWEWLLRPRPLLRWQGKRFRSVDRVNALMTHAFGLTFAAPLGAAIVRPVEYRGVVSAAMIYGWLPIVDHFRRVDAETVMGLMESRGRTAARFVLRREA